MIEKETRQGIFLDFMNEILPIDDIMSLIDTLDKIGFFTAPASVKYHGNYEGGLFDHSLAVMNSLLAITKGMSLKWELPRSPYIIGMFHDLCKCDLYVKKSDGTFDYANNVPLTGHGDKSVIITQNILGRLTEEETLCIRWHMGAYDDSKVWNNLGAAIEQYPNVLWTHTADMVASRIMGI